MRPLWFGIALFILGSPVFAQLDPFTVSVSAVRSVSVIPDTVVISVSVEVSPNIGLSDVLTLVQPAGLSQSDLSGVFSVNDGPDDALNAVWSFSQTIPFSGLKASLSKLDALQAAGAKRNSGFSVSYQVSGAQASPQAQAAQPCPMGTLVADARTKAQALAQAAGFGIGEIVTISDQGASTVGVVELSSASVIGLFNPAPVAPNFCAITVTFKLTLNQ